jgi:hypothetical protein
MGRRRWSYTVRVLGACLALGASAVAVPACSAAEDAATAGTGPTSTTSTAPTTTAAPRDPADRATVELALAATLKGGDFPEGWTVHTPGKERVLSAGSCSHREDGPESKLLAGAAQDGPSVQLTGQGAFVTSFSFVLDSEADAREWLDTVRTAEWADCRAAQLDEFQQRQGSDMAVDLETRQVERLGEDGFEAYAQFVGRTADGATALVVDVLHYRIGRVVLENTLERSTTLDEAAWAAVDNAHNAGVRSVWARLSAAGVDG